jgi:hypothetical protein
MDPVKLYKEGSEKLVASLDAPAWLADGWGTEKPEPEAPAEPPIEEAAIETESDAPVDAEVKLGAKRK